MEVSDSESNNSEWKGATTDSTFLHKNNFNKLAKFAKSAYKLPSTENDKSYMNSSENFENFETNDHTIYDNTYENDYDPDYETHEFYNTEIVGCIREKTFPYECLYNIEHNSECQNQKEKNYKNTLTMQNELIFQNDMLRNVLKSSQNMKEMQRELFNVDVKNFVPVSPPQTKSAYSVQREYSKMYDNDIHEDYDLNNSNSNSTQNANKPSCYNTSYECNAFINKENLKHKNITVSKEEKHSSKQKLPLQPPRIGEIKVNIDDIKTGLLSYYSNIYSLDHYDIEDRISILKYGDKNISDSVNVKYFYKKEQVSKRLPFIHYNDELNNPNSFSYQNTPVDYYYSGDAHNSKWSTPHHFHMNNLTNKEAKLEEEAEKEEETKLKKVNASENAYDHVGQIAELLTSLKNKCADANFKAQTLISKFNSKYENPDNRFWIHDLVPVHLRKPKLNDDDGIRKHIAVTYAQLYNEAMLNKKKITALEKKLHILKLRANSYKNGHRMETRNAL
ncbi:conserved Plasmodium protein, unknown function [Plasmodium malariae]|uniref:Uncharacterized protein n=1 Tax=Plasmodium malariae TaxID=5858 RepID=A0A1A8W184_PLAMA|nr:conserved Plasmodium protein, unknown function [Plasmodium malariae]